MSQQDNMIMILKKQLSKLNFNEAKQFRCLQEKDGVFVYQFVVENQSYVLKYYENEKYRREITYYHLLQKLDIPTIHFYACSESLIVLEDINESKDYRLASKSDMSDLYVGTALGKWYRGLHDKSVEYVKENKDMYREIDLITHNDIENVISKTNSRNNIVWKLIQDTIDNVLNRIKQLDEVITYNDFYFTNMIVGREKPVNRAFMFDYNMMSIGLRYNDIRNVCSSLSPEAGAAFRAEYGPYNLQEKLIDGGLSALITMIVAFKLDVSPKWASESIEELHNGKLLNDYKLMLEVLNINC